ncbi:MAG: hypothetical protein QOF92_888 [Pseudonocardiales bacterium]|nr:hypothetical protein [Pseudonocardiales bacterium]
MPAVLVAQPSADTYGSDRQLLESIHGLRASGWDVTVCLPDTGPLVELLDGVEVDVSPFPVLRKALLRPVPIIGLLLRTPLDLLRLVRRIRARRPDVVYVNTVTIPLWILAARLARVPVLVHVHEAEDAAARPVRIALNAPLLLAQVVVANSAASAHTVADAVPRLTARTVVIPNGIPDSGPAPATDAQPGRVALIARLSPRKGVDVALEAVARLRREGRDVQLDICGTAYAGYEWFERDLRQRAAQPDLAGAVRLHGYVNPTTPMLATASVVIVPSRVEPFGNTAVEGMLAARPVVASRVQGLAEIVDDGRTGLLVEPDDPAALAAAIARLLDDPDAARQLATAGRTEAQLRFSASRYRREIEKALTGATRG